MRTLQFTLMLAAITAVVVLPMAAQDAEHFTVLHTFTGGGGAGDPGSQLVEDSAGNFYGSTFWDGNHEVCAEVGCGVVYRVSPDGSSWRYTVLYEFSENGEGAEPTQLVLDAAGNLYGELSSGGAFDAGSVFELSPTSSGPWTYTNLYTFTGGADGNLPSGGLVFDGVGNLYGATAFGGSEEGGMGAVFKLAPNGSGGWTESVIYSSSVTNDHPTGPLIFDGAGNLYGVWDGEDGDVGGVFELKPGSGGWTFASLYSFGGGNDGATPEAGVVRDAAGNLYGTTAYGGAHNDGTVYELSPNVGGYAFTVLHTFAGGNGGANSFNPVILDASGNLFGTALGGADNWGVMFELSPSSSGWTYGLVHTFTGGPDGGYASGLIFDLAGNLYGAAAYGARAGCLNDSGCGTVFKLSSTVAAGH
ncbi:MAG: choice-of-anchor tandem repeat GloVer-containing protein [Candidatus Sulfotelmatobacter sp.]